MDIYEIGPHPVDFLNDMCMALTDDEQKWKDFEALPEDDKDKVEAMVFAKKMIEKGWVKR